MQHLVCHLVNGIACQSNSTLSSPGVIMNQESRALGGVSAFNLTHIALTILVLVSAGNAFAGDVNIAQIQAAAARGKVPQEVKLAGAYFVGRGVQQNLKMAAYWYEKAAEHGDPVAENEIGYMYQAGIGVSQDPARGCRWYQLAAASGLISAKVNLGVAYFWGSGVPKDTALATELFREAANKGSGAAATYLGDLYYLGIGLDQNRAAGERWYETGVKLHDPISAFNLGSLYFKASDHPHDFPKAARLFRQSAAAGYVPAMHSLGVLLIKHPEFAKSAQEGRTSLETAAESGFWRSSIVLGILARDGNGTSVDQVAAYYYFQIAALQGGDNAKKMLANDFKKLSDTLNADQIREQNSRADSWCHEHPFAVEFVHQDTRIWNGFPSWGHAIDENGVEAGQLLPVPLA